MNKQEDHLPKKIKNTPDSGSQPLPVDLKPADLRTPEKDFANVSIPFAGGDTAFERYLDASDEELMEGVKRRDSDAMSMLWLKYHEPLKKICARRLSRSSQVSPDSVEDAIQGTFISIFRYPDNFKAEPGRDKPFLRWASSIARNTTTAILKRETKNREGFVSTHNEEGGERSGLVATAEGTSDPSAKMMYEEEVRGIPLFLHLLLESFNSLSPQDQEILNMQQQEGMTTREIDEKLGLKKNTAKMRLVRARSRWRRGMGVMFRKAGIPKQGLE